VLDTLKEAWQNGATFRQTLPDGFLGTVSYVGSKGTHLLSLSYVNVIDPLTSLPTYSPTLKSQIACNQSNSTNKGLGVSFGRSSRRALLSWMNYTWSHEIDDGSMGSGDGDSLTPEMMWPEPGTYFVQRS